MKIINEVEQSEVWKHWAMTETHIKPELRSEIRDPLPDDMKWYTGRIEKSDIENMYIISSSDWTDISNGSFLVADVASRLDLPTENPDTKRISDNIREKILFLKSGGILDTKLIAITNCSELKGPFVFIEGNKRSVTFAVLNTLVDSEIFIGISPEITDYVWAWHTYN